jgi:hypothetical protein
MHTNTGLKRLAQDLEDVASKLRMLIEKEHATMRQRQVAGHRHLPAPDQPYSRDRVVGGTTRARGDDGGAGAGAAPRPEGGRW